MSTFKQYDTPLIEQELGSIETLENVDRVKIYVQHDESGTLVVNDTVDAYDAEDVTVEYRLSQAQTARVGVHQVEFVVHYSDGRVLSSPASDYIRIESNEPLDRELEVDPANPDPDISVTSLDVDRILANSDSTIEIVDPLDDAAGITYGDDPAETITETDSPTSWTFEGNATRDVHRSTDVSVSNSTTSSATEDITVELYDGTDSTGTQLLSETQSISLADGASTTATFIATDQALDGGTYYLEVTQSGSTLSIDQTDEHTRGAAYETGQQADGTRYLKTQFGDTVLLIDPITGAAAFDAASVETAPTESTDVARLAELQGKADDPHAIGGSSHDASTLSELNALVSDATLDDTSDTREPIEHALASAYHSASTLSDLNALVSDATLDDSSSSRPPESHAIGGSDHNASTLADLNALVSDATLDDSSSSRPPESHAIGGSQHSGSTVADVNALITDATLATLADLYTDSDAQAAVEGSVDAADLIGSSGTSGQVLETDGDQLSWVNPPSAPVDSVFGRTGAVSAQSGDYAVAQLGNVDVSALLEGLDADKPAAGTAGRYYWATDTAILYRDNGSSWTAIAGTGSSSTPVPGTTHVEALSADSELGNPVYATLSDVPSDLPEGAQVYVQDENAVYVEDGT